MKKWQLQDAKNKFSKVAEDAIQYGPQLVTRHGQEAVVILSTDEYRKLTARPGSLVEFLRSSPLVGSEISFERESSGGREVKL